VKTVASCAFSWALAAAALGLPAVTASGQETKGRPRVAPPGASVVSPEVGADRKVSFRIYADKAAEVQLRNGPGTISRFHDLLGIAR
jgi:hypothetical protein